MRIRTCTTYNLQHTVNLQHKKCTVSKVNLKVKIYLHICMEMLVFMLKPRSTHD